MKNHLPLMKLVIVLLVMISGSVAHGQKGTINETELEFVKNYLTVSLESTTKTLDGVDNELWNYTPKSGGWSVGECMEHIMLAENALFKQIQGALSKEADNKKDLTYQDGYVITKTVDRGKKVKTPLEPQTVSMSKAEYVKWLKKSRKAITSFIEKPGLELRNHFGPSPFGEVDAYQLVLIIAGHGMRHTAQMNEVIEEFNTRSSD